MPCSPSEEENIAGDRVPEGRNRSKNMNGSFRVLMTSNGNEDWGLGIETEGTPRCRPSFGGWGSEALLIAATLDDRHSIGTEAEPFNGGVLHRL